MTTEIEKFYYCNACEKTLGHGSYYSFRNEVSIFENIQESDIKDQGLWCNECHNEIIKNNAYLYVK